MRISQKTQRVVIIFAAIALLLLSFVAAMPHDAVRESLENRETTELWVCCTRMLPPLLKLIAFAGPLAMEIHHCSQEKVGMIHQPIPHPRPSLVVLAPVPTHPPQPAADEPKATAFRESPTIFSKQGKVDRQAKRWGGKRRTSRFRRVRNLGSCLALAPWVFVRNARSQ
jgi:hypothetical protein